MNDLHVLELDADKLEGVAGESMFRLVRGAVAEQILVLPHDQSFEVIVPADGDRETLWLVSDWGMRGQLEIILLRKRIHHVGRTPQPELPEG